MPTPLPSAAPRSSNLVVPATQGTAPVIKFRCLFTHDLRRKAKRWQDGFLRFHTFNKRVMVYDNTGYFIGDLHYRAPEGIQDGDELELDKGVLIQVCEPLEQTETDISSLFKSKTQASPPRPGDAPPPSSGRLPTPRLYVSSQQASRSLNDLLGIKKPTASQSGSLYEQRSGQRQIITPQRERPAKRQRTASPERTSPPSGQQDVIDLSDSSAQRQPDSIPEPHRNSTTKPQNDCSSTVPRLRAPEFQGNNSAAKQPQNIQNPPPQHIQRDPKPANLGSEAPINTLRLSGDRPRRKLMYLESSKSSVRASQIGTQIQRAHSQCGPAIKHEALSSSPLIVLDDDDDDPAPQQPQTNKTHEVKPALAPGLPVASPTFGQGDSISDQSLPPHINHGKAPDLKPPQNSITPPNTILAPNPMPSLPSAHSADSMGNPAKRRSTVLCKSFSDPTTINNLHPKPLPTTSPLNPCTDDADKQDEKGPWTSEALDFFDFWPPGRPKPT